MIDVLCTLWRDGNMVSTNIPVRLEYASDMEQHAMAEGRIPFYRYSCYVRQILDMRQNDQLQDQMRTDPVTHAPVTYQVVSRPETFPDGHMRFKADDVRVVGFS